MRSSEIATPFFYRRTSYDSRSGSGGRRCRRGEYTKTHACKRRAAGHRRNDVARVQTAYRKGPRARKTLSTCDRRRAGRGKTEEILRSLRPQYQSHHRVTITDGAIKAAIRLSKRYLPDRFLPDKAIDLIDEASSKRAWRHRSRRRDKGSLKASCAGSACAVNVPLWTEIFSLRRSCAGR